MAAESRQPKHLKDLKTIRKFLKEKFPSGCLTAKEVLELAKPKNSPIHKYFDWDDSVAAAQWRLKQAREIIQCVVIEIDGNKIREYVTPVFVEGYSKKQYVEFEKAMSAPDIKSQVLERALHELDGFKRRYETLKELSLVFKAIDRTIKNHK